MCKMLHFQNIIVCWDRVAYIMRISVCICPSSFTHQRVCEQSCQVRGDQLSLSFDRDQVSQRHSVTLSPPMFLCAHVCVCVSVGHTSPETPPNLPQAKCLDDTHGRLPGVNLRWWDSSVCVWFTSPEINDLLWRMDGKHTRTVTQFWHKES